MKTKKIKKKKLIKEFNYVNKLDLCECNAPIKELIDSIASIYIIEE